MKKRGGIALAGIAIIAGLVALAVAGPWVLPENPTAIAGSRALRAPTLGEPFGMDDLCLLYTSPSPRD